MGMLITFEGLDGSGKSTQARLLADRLESEGRPVELLREPGGTAVSEHIRSLLLHDAAAMEPMTELLLFSAARAQLCRERLVPLLNDGVIVLLDRFYDSTTAYQGAGRGVAETDWLSEFHRHVTGGLEPVRTYYLRLHPEAAASRQASRDAGDADRMEMAGVEFFRRVAHGYDRLAERHERYRVLDATLSIEALHDLIWADASRLSGNPGVDRR